MLFHFASRGSVVHCHVILSKSKIDAGLKSQKMLLFDVFVACSRLLQDSNPHIFPGFIKLIFLDLSLSFFLCVLFLDCFYFCQRSLLGELLLKLAGLRRAFFKEPLEGRHSEILTSKKKKGEKMKGFWCSLWPPTCTVVFPRCFTATSQESVNRAVEPLFGVTSSLEGPFASLGKTVSIEFQWFDIAPQRFSQGIPKVPQESWWHCMQLF